MGQETLNNESSKALPSLRQPGHLPSEIFTEILILTLPPLTERQAPQLKVLSLVCRFWHLVVDSTPALWSRISNTDNISHVRKAISKSGEHPIDVCGDSWMPSVDWGSGGDESDSTMFLAQEHIRRWRHVMLRPPTDQGSTPALAILPWLQTLKLHSRNNSVLSDQFLALLNRQHTSPLRQVSVSGLHIARLHLISFPPTLSSLEISQMTVDHALIAGWLSIIAACPRLAQLRLYHISTSPGHVVKRDKNNGPALVKLNRLQELDLDLVHSDIILEILLRLRLPEQCRIYIRCELQSPNPSTSFLSPALSSQRNFQRAGKGFQATITLAECLESVLVANRLWHIKLYLPGTQAIRNALDWFVIRGEDSNASSPHPGSLKSGLATSISPPVVLKLCPNWLPRNFTQLGAISDFWNIKWIEMDFLSEKERMAFLFYLSTPKDPNQPTRPMADFLGVPEAESNRKVEGVWPFPGLSELVRRESHDNVAQLVLLEPIGAQCNDDATAGKSRRATRSELREPSTPWEKVVR